MITGVPGPNIPKIHWPNSASSTSSLHHRSNELLEPLLMKPWEKIQKRDADMLNQLMAQWKKHHIITQQGLQTNTVFFFSYAKHVLIVVLVAVRLKHILQRVGTVLHSSLMMHSRAASSFYSASYTSRLPGRTIFYAILGCGLPWVWPPSH